MEKNLKYWKNPFEFNIVEDWKPDDKPQNYRDLVSCFFPPEFMSKLESTDLKPKIIMGGRGTGKSHILRMLSIQSVINRAKIKKSEIEKEDPERVKLTISDYMEPYLGIYLKSMIFFPLSSTNITFLKEDQLKPIFEHYFNMQICIKILDSLVFLIANIDIKLDCNTEERICNALGQLLNDTIECHTFSETIKRYESQTKIIERLIKEFPLHQDFSKYDGQIFFTSSPDFIVNFFNILRKELNIDKDLVILLDEYDELDEYQQEFINKIIRTRTLPLRIASKINGIKTLEYAKGRELNEIHDYDPIIPLHFDISNEKSGAYKRLLQQIFIKRMKLYGHYKIKDPKKILISPTLVDEKISEEDLSNELKNIHESLKRKYSQDADDYWRNFKGHYREAAIYRILREKGRSDKLYAGFDEYSNLSSGIVRQFILLCRDAFSIAHYNGIQIENGVPIPLKMQSDTAKSLAKTLLYDEQSKNISSEYGNRLIGLIEDFGRILQAKLYWSTEPQSNKIEIVGGQKFYDEEYTIPKEIIESGLKMPHLISATAFKPKHPEYSKSFTFSINGIFAPHLSIPTEKRWTTSMRIEELKNLCSNDKREITLQQIIKDIKGKQRKTRGKIKLEKGEIPSQTKIPDYHPPIRLTNCPITGVGCTKNLSEYYIDKNGLKAFLAVPFSKDSWVYDPRKWIKKVMTDNHSIRTVDIDDFPQGVLLCKICSCVRQMPIGLFEITELNPNVIFELGMATVLNKANFLLVYPDKIPSKFQGDFPPAPFYGIEYVPYELSENAINNVLGLKVVPAISNLANNSNIKLCSLIQNKCDCADIKPCESIFVGLPFDQNQNFFSEVENVIRECVNSKVITKVIFFKPADSINKLCQICRMIKESEFCIIDTTYNDFSMLFALGVAFGRDKKFIQLHNSELGDENPISDMRSWTISYSSTEDLKNKLSDEFSKRVLK